MTMQMCRCNLVHIAQQSTTSSRRATERLHQEIIRTVLPRHIHYGHRRRQHNKHNNKKLLALRYGTLRVSKASKKKTQKGPSTQVIQNASS